MKKSGIVFTGIGMAEKGDSDTALGKRKGESHGHRDRFGYGEHSGICKG